MGYPLLDEATTIIQALKQYSLEVEKGCKESLMVSITPIRRILGYVQYMAANKDEHGWQMLLDTERMTEYIQLLKESGASPSTCKNYCDKIITVMKLAETYFFDHLGTPKDPAEVSHHYPLLKGVVQISSEFIIM